MLKAETIGGNVMAFQKILEPDYNTKGARLLETKPDMEAETLKRKFDELSLDVLIPKYNALVDALNEILGSTTGVQTIITNDDAKLVTGGAVSRYVVQMGGGDMTKAIYDTDDDGVVDDSDKLGGMSASDYQLKSDDTLNTTDQTIVGGINELKAEMDNKSANYNSCTTYSPTATYALGDLAIYDNKLYRCTTAIATPEAWSVGKWTQITDSLNGLVYNTSDNYFYGVRGADSVLKKLGSGKSVFLYKTGGSSYSGIALDVREYKKLTINASTLTSSLRVDSVSALNTNPFANNNNYGTLIQNVTTTGSDVTIDISSYDYITLRYYKVAEESNKYYLASGDATITIE
jgi:hypothetical protein